SRYEMQVRRTKIRHQSEKVVDLRHAILPPRRVRYEPDREYRGVRQSSKKKARNRNALSVNGETEALQMRSMTKRAYENDARAMKAS
ncbi:hypothetical protein, partial [Petrachloros mirabilis]